MALTVVDRAMQAFGAEGVSQDQPLAKTWAGLRTLRIADVSVLVVYWRSLLTRLHRVLTL
jgi:alkylation response protein AidB-like acyl-CoA dehydrogenase